MNQGPIYSFAERLDRKGIRYCHWKGNFLLSEVLSGEKDFDILVDRKSLTEVTGTLSDMGFKRAFASSEEEAGAVSHYYGLDPQTGALSHVHLYSSLFTGESFINSHWLPFEQMLLENLDNIGGISVPSRPAEFISYIMRVLVKHGAPLDLVYLLRESKEREAEFRWLCAGTDLSEALALLRRHCPVIDERLFIECIDSLSSPRSLFRRMVVAQRVRRRLRVYERDSGLKRWWAYVGIVWHEGWRRVRRRRKGKILEGGGGVIAFVGAEATGKTTLASECCRWLGSAFVVQLVHAGKPPSSWLTAPINGLLPLVRRCWPDLRTSRIERHIASKHPNHPAEAQPSVEGWPALVRALRAVVLACDRRRLLLKARRSAANGEIVICDRYPSDVVGAMDSPRLQERPDQKGIIPAVCNWLARLEHRLYREIPAPDVVIRLKVPIETAKQRNRERIKADKESDAYVESRHRQSPKWSRSGTRYVFDVHTDQPLAQTVLCVKRQIWEVL